jgi:KDO2-lipid IV(A) lauroyltransferase
VTKSNDGDAPRKSTLFWQHLVLTALKGATRGVRLLSRPAALRFGTGLGRLAFMIDKKRRRLAERNLRLAYGDELTCTQRAALIRGTFEHWGVGVIEFLRASGLDAAQMNALVAEVEGWEHVEAVRARGGGFIVVTGHIGNFEFMGRWMASRGIPSTVIARDPAAPALAAYMRSIREYAGNVALSKGSSGVRVLLTLLKQGRTITLGVDQNSGDLFVPFFGVPAGTVAGPALLSLRTGAPLLPAFCVFDPDGRYRLIFLPPITVVSTGDRDADMARTMAEVNDVLEGIVRRYPDQWLWLHNRWKSAFEEKNRERWPEGFDFAAAQRVWEAAVG